MSLYIREILSIYSPLIYNIVYVKPIFLSHNAISLSEAVNEIPLALFFLSIQEKTPV